MEASKIIISFLVFGLSGSTTAWAQRPALNEAGPSENRACIRWDAPGDQAINKLQAERLYLDALRWVDEHVARRKGTERPCIAVIVGKPCPDASRKGSCINPVTGEIYLPRWERGSAAAVAQGAISTMLLHLLDNKEITQAAKSLLAEDRNNYLDFVRREGAK